MNFFFKGLTLHELLQALEEGNDSDGDHTEIDLAILAPSNSCEPVPMNTHQ